MDIESLESLIGTKRDSALLRVAIANALLMQEKTSKAQEQLSRATEMDPAYTAAWKQLGKVCVSLDDTDIASGAKIKKLVGDFYNGRINFDCLDLCIWKCFAKYPHQ